MASETIVINGYYIDADFYEMVCDEARKKIIAENQKKKRTRARSRRTMERRRYFIMQKIVGLILAVSAVIVTLITCNSIWLLFVIPAVYAMQAKRMIAPTRYLWSRKRKRR